MIGVAVVGYVHQDHIAVTRFKHQMNHQIAAIYHLLLQSQYRIWTINPIKVHLVLHDGMHCLGGNAEQRNRWLMTPHMLDPRGPSAEHTVSTQKQK